MNPSGFRCLFSRLSLNAGVLAAVVLSSCAARTEYLRQRRGLEQPAEVRKALDPSEPTPAPVPSQIDDVARFLAGLPGAGDSALDAYRARPEWARHTQELNVLWRRFNAQRRDPINSWAAAELGGLRSAHVLFYPFSGPDFLYANAFFPDARATVLCGLESAEPLPELTSLTEEQRVAALDGLATALTSSLNFSFFITKDMRSDLGRTELRGTLPILLTFLARANERVQSVDLVSLDGSGRLVSRGAGRDPGFRIYCASGRTVYYFTTNLANGPFTPNGRFATFVRTLGPMVTFTKSASYLMHTDDFSNVRNFILERSAAVLQDDSGIPLRHFASGQWTLELFGRYSGTIDLFKQYYQSELAEAHAGGSSPLGFGIGYKHTEGQSAMLLARRR